MIQPPATPPTSDMPPAEIASCETGSETPGCDRRESQSTPIIWQEYVATAKKGDLFKVPFHPVATVLDVRQLAGGVQYVVTEGGRASILFVADFDPGDIGNPCDDGGCEPSTPPNAA